MTKKTICILLGIFLLMTLVVITLGSAAGGDEPEPMEDHSNQDCNIEETQGISKAVLENTPGDSVEPEDKHRF